mgnify:CR=1 FL=1
MIATGLGGGDGEAAAASTPNMTLVEQPQVVAAHRAPTTSASRRRSVNYEHLDQPAVVRAARRRRAGAAPAFDATEIPAFLRKQAD